jgi:hypothetical protein
MFKFSLQSLEITSVFDCFFLEKKSLFFFKGSNGVIVLKMPSFYFYKNSLNCFSFLFKNTFFFKSFFSHFLFLFRSLHTYFFFKLKVRGLGYRIRGLAKNLFRFFLGTTNYLFFHVPSNILVRVRRRKMLLVANDLSLLRLIFVNLLLLKKLIPYQLRGIFFPKQIILLKSGKKSF